MRVDPGHTGILVTQDRQNPPHTEAGPTPCERGAKGDFVPGASRPGGSGRGPPTCGMSHEIFEAALRVWGRDFFFPGLVESALKSCGIASGSGLAEVGEEDLPKLLDKTIIR